MNFSTHTGIASFRGYTDAHGAVDADNPVRLRAAECRFIETVIFLAAVSYTHLNELFLIAQGKLVNQSGKVVELIKALVLAKHLLNTVDRTFVVGDKPLFKGLTLSLIHI